MYADNVIIRSKLFNNGVIKMDIIKVKPEHKKLLKSLYLSAFPVSERKPFHLMQIWEKAGKMEILELCDKDMFCGLVVTALCGDLVLIDYLAIVPELRGQGIGTKAIELIRRRYTDKRIFLEIESTLEESDGMEQKLSRKKFYLNNGLTECGFCVKLFGVNMEILSFNENITFDEYLHLYDYLAGNYVKGKIRKL